MFADGLVVRPRCIRDHHAIVGGRLHIHTVVADTRATNDLQPRLRPRLR